MLNPEQTSQERLEYWLDQLKTMSDYENKDYVLEKIILELTDINLQQLNKVKRQREFVNQKMLQINEKYNIVNKDGLVLELIAMLSDVLDID